ncbi:hypothetical protein [Paraburkholderia solisilvae]|uniref:Uncharacterized protein n=1 Tax=Paraburkholderia solisilvae TaxID=624376 RepID=A0A6J5DFC7_9BURK|nr:hypothetical protein [Paraburkholderia solisilvae]CAB3751576.1 hypothetical protein LMG29739_01325 [Paraburkholderia solisilvae]
MGFLSRLWRRTGDKEQGDSSRSSDRADEVAQTIARVAKAIPKLTLAARYESRLAPAVRGTLDYASGIVAALPRPRDAAASAWSSDPYIHAFFATSDDVCETFGRSHELRDWFNEHIDCAEVYAVLGMEMAERTALGVAQQDGRTRTDVRQTTISFSDHRVRICGRTEADLHDEIVRRLVDQLALEALEQIAEDKSRRDALEEERALLKARLQLLQRQGAGMHAVTSGAAPVDLAEVARLQRELDANERSLAALGSPTEAIERQFDIVQRIYADPAAYTYVTVKQVRLDRMNVMVDISATQPAADLELRVARIPASPSDTRAFAIVRFRRADLPPAGSLFGDTSRVIV